MFHHLLKERYDKIGIHHASIFVVQIEQRLRLTSLFSFLTSKTST